MIEQLLHVGRYVSLLEVPADVFISGEELATITGITQGISINSNSPWLKFVDEGKVLYIAKKPFRSHISWDHLNGVGVISGANHVNINGQTYKVRLLKGASTDPLKGNGIGYDPSNAHGSEWNKYLYPVIASSTQVSGTHSSEGIEFGTLARYTEADLGLGDDGGDGRHSWCQEASSTSNTIVCRGRYGVVYLGNPHKSWTDWFLGWRPVLELVE